MLKSLRQQIIRTIWKKYQTTSLEMQKISLALQQHQIVHPPLDHFAIIDLPSSVSGISTLKHIFQSIGYQQRGEGYLPEKQNGFLWLAEEECENSLAKTALPQVVVADFCLEAVPIEVRRVIEKYTQHLQPAPLTAIKHLAQLADKGDQVAANECTDLIITYLAGRDWPLPSLREYDLVKEFNELLSWVLVFGRRPNHFTLSIHLLSHFVNLAEFHEFIETHAQLSINQEGGRIKGSKASGIEQGSTNGVLQTTELSDGSIQVPTGFVEFVWRYTHSKPQHQATLWQDYFTGFISNHANKVIESLCIE